MNFWVNVETVLHKSRWIIVKAKSFDDAEKKAKKRHEVLRVFEVSVVPGGVVT